MFLFGFAEMFSCLSSGATNQEVDFFVFNQLPFPEFSLFVKI